MWINSLTKRINFGTVGYSSLTFEECGITEFPSTVSAMKDACEKISAAELVSGFENGTAKISDYPERYNNFFDFIDLAVKYGDDKPLETALDGEESVFGTGKAAMLLGQGAWIEADVLSVDPDIQSNFEIMQSYIAGDLDKDGACAQIEKQWQEIDGAQ